MIETMHELNFKEAEAVAGGFPGWVFRLPSYTPPTLKEGPDGFTCVQTGPTTVECVIHPTIKT